MATFQERFNILFDESDKSQKEFGDLFGASDDQVYNWRRNRGEPDSEMMKRIANACNVTVSWIVGESDERKLNAVAGIIARAEQIELSNEQKNALKDYKNMTPKEQEERLLIVLDKLKNLSSSEQEVLFKIIDSLSSHQ